MFFNVKGDISGNYFVWIVVSTLLLVGYASQCPVLAQDSLIVNDNSNYNTNDPLTVAEKHLVKVLKTTDSLFNIDKTRSLVYLNKNLDSMGINNVQDELKAAYLHTYGKLLVENGKPGIGVETLLASLRLKKSIYGNADSRLAKTYNYIGIGRFRMHD